MSEMYPPQPDADEHYKPDDVDEYYKPTQPSEEQPGPGAQEKPKTTTLTNRTIVLDLDYHAAAALAYLPFCFFNVIASAVFWRTEPENNYFLRFHSMQSLVLTGGMIVLEMGCAVGMMVFA